jgi:hypothetical protein
MIETGIAIIASSLPSLRTLVYATRSRNGSSGPGKHYELSSQGPRPHTVTNTNVTGGSRLDRRKPMSNVNESDEDLFKDEIISTSESIGEDVNTHKLDHGIVITKHYRVSEGSLIHPPHDTSGRV